MITISLGDGYKINAKRIDVPSGFKFSKNFSFVAVGWCHPNYGYFADAGFFWKSMHINSWQLVPLHSMMKEYAIEIKIAGKPTVKPLPPCVNSFLKDYPQFKGLFEEVI